MAIKHEIKSQLAKLLATEDLIVEHKRVETAQFDVHTRVLTLPTWDRASESVYDMLVGHEVGHALYTPDIDWSVNHRISKDVVNIVEDARIEKLMKRRYPGLAKTFYHGYNELNDDDFFKIDGENLNSFNLADRINLYFKIGSWVNISFTSSEAQIVNLIDKCETFDDTLDVAQKLYDYCKQEEEDLSKIEVNIGDGEEFVVSGSGGEKDTDDMTDEELLEELGKPPQQPSRTDDPAQLDVPSFKQQGGKNGDDLEVQTAHSLEESIKDLVESGEYNSNIYVELPKVRLDNVVVSNGVIHNQIKGYWVEEKKEWEKNLEIYGRVDQFGEVDGRFADFKKSAQKEVNYLVKEFECRKAADNYARSATNRTGILDTTKLHTYRFNEDIFKKISVVPDGKNHGLIFVLDWSGSMAHVMLDTIKQLYNLLWFCKKVNIPFEVYAFTNDYPRDFDKLVYDKKEGLALLEATFSLMNLFTSKVRSNVLEEQMINIWRISSAFAHEGYCPFSIPLGLNLSGTPLNESLICLHQIIPQFKRNNKLQKVQCVVLTDGEAAPLRYSKHFYRGDWETGGYMGSRYVDESCVIRNRKTGYTYSCKGMGYWADVTDILIKDLRQCFPDTNFIGIRVLNNRDAGQFIRKYIGYTEEYENVMKKWRKEKSFSIKKSGYHTYFGLSANSLAEDDEFEVQEDATKAQIKRAFVKSLRTKKMNKKVLGEFIELVA